MQRLEVLEQLQVVAQRTGLSSLGRQVWRQVRWDDAVLRGGRRSGELNRATLGDVLGSVVVNRDPRATHVAWGDSHLGLPTTPPPLSPARGPPQHGLAFDADHDFDLDQTPAYDPGEPEPAPAFDLDQSAGA